MRAMAGQHEIVFISPEYLYASEERAQRLIEEFVSSCDILVGVPNAAVLAARRRIDSGAPLLGFLLGLMPRGAWPLKEVLHLLTSRDVLIANCVGEQQLVTQFVQNATVRLVPFAFDPTVFYPLSAEERRSVRASIGLAEQDRVLIYVGRVMLEKNLHTLLRIFSGVQHLVPNVRLLIAGPVAGSSFLEFGVLALNPLAALEKAVVRLGIPPGRVRLLGATDGNRVRELLNVADLKVNMTLHHDENFGLAQVQAMACGTPVIGTAWGGLNDTILDGTSGYKVSAVPTLSGVKVDWWEAVNLIVKVLKDSNERERLRESSIRHANALYSQSMYEKALLQLLSYCDVARDGAGTPLTPTPFAEEYWRVCSVRVTDSAPYRRGRRASELYRELMMPFSGRSNSHVPSGEPLSQEQLLSLPARVEDAGCGRLRIEDPIYPCEVEVPVGYDRPVRVVIAALLAKPVMSVGEVQSMLQDAPNTEAALTWMCETGLMLRTQPHNDWLTPDLVNALAHVRLFDVLRVDRATTDFIVY